MDIVIRAFFAFLVIIVTRVIEATSLRRWSLDLILLIVLGDLIQQGVTQSDYSFTGLVLAGGTFTALTVAVSYLVFRFRRVRPLFEPELLILVEDGKVIDRNLRSAAHLAGASRPRLASSRSLHSRRCGGRCSRRAARSASFRSSA